MTQESEKLAALVQLRGLVSTPRAHNNQERATAHAMLAIADVHQTDAEGSSLLATAMRNNHRYLAEALCVMGVDVNMANNLKQTALHDAVRQCDPEPVVWLLAHGANPTLRDQFDFNPLEYALAEIESEQFKQDEGARYEYDDMSHQDNQKILEKWQKLIALLLDAGGWFDDLVATTVAVRDYMKHAKERVQSLLSADRLLPSQLMAADLCYASNCRQMEELLPRIDWAAEPEAAAMLLAGLPPYLSREIVCQSAVLSAVLAQPTHHVTAPLWDATLTLPAHGAQPQR